MRFKTLTGRTRTIPKAKKYLINWSGKSKSKIQRRTKQFLKEYWKHHIVFEEFPVAGTRLTLDFYNANKKIAVEISHEVIKQTMGTEMNLSSISATVDDISKEKVIKYL